MGNQPPVNGGGGDSCSDGIDNDKDGKTDGDDPECQEGGDGTEDGTDVAPTGRCGSADLVLLNDVFGDDTLEIVCLYGPGKGEAATEEGECEGALIATGPDPILGGGLCVFLPE